MSSVFNICGGENNSFTPAPRKIVPQGTLEITENGEYDVSQYANVNVNVPSGGNDGFAKLPSGQLTEIPRYIPQGDSICDYAFAYQKNLQNAVLPEGVIHIGSYVFRNDSQLKMIDLPSTVTNLSTNAISNNVLPLLKQFVVRAKTPPQISNNSLSGLPTDCLIYVPSESVEAYKTATYWNARASYIQAIQN